MFYKQINLLQQREKFGLGSAGLAAGFDDPKGLFLNLNDSVIL